MKPTIPIGRVFGVPIGLHYSWFIILTFFSWSLGHSFLPDRYPGWTEPMYWITGIVAALLLFASVLLHELAHSLVAKSLGLSVGGITLFLLGGVTNLCSEARSAWAEFLVAVSGPLTSLAVSLVLWGVYQIFEDTTTPLAAAIWYLWIINLVLGLFNLLPAFPMDGGRVLRSVVWGTTGSIDRATRVSSMGGIVVAALVVAMGILEGLRGSWLSGVWYVMIGWFILRMALRSR